MAFSPTQLRLMTIAISLLVQGCVLGINDKDQLVVKRGGCGSHLAAVHIASLGDRTGFRTGFADRIRNNPSTLDDNGGAAALHNSVTDFGPSTHKCGATLISNRWLLTAAHCFKSERLSGISIGRDNLVEDPSPGINTYEIEKVIEHPDYKPANYRYNDLALIRSKSEIKYGTKVWPYCLPSSHLDIHDYMHVKIAGWGTVDASGKSSSKVQVANTKIVENSRCRADWEYISPTGYENLQKMSYPNGITKQVLCAGIRGVDACRGDSGGPMTHQDRSGLYSVIGIVAFGIDGCPKNPVLPGFYSNVQYYLEWIYSNTGLTRPTSTTNPQQNTPQPPGQQIRRFTTLATTKRPQPPITTWAPHPVTTARLPGGFVGSSDGGFGGSGAAGFGGSSAGGFGGSIASGFGGFSAGGFGGSGADEFGGSSAGGFGGSSAAVGLVQAQQQTRGYAQNSGGHSGGGGGDAVIGIIAGGEGGFNTGGGYGSDGGGGSFGGGHSGGGFSSGGLIGGGHNSGISSGGYGNSGGSSGCEYWCKSPTDQYYCCQQPDQGSSGGGNIGGGGLIGGGHGGGIISGGHGGGIIGGSVIGGGGGNGGSAIHPGQCPPVRPQCPPTRFGPPKTCSSDVSCGWIEKCCFDTCLQRHLCKPAQNGNHGW